MVPPAEGTSPDVLAGLIPFLGWVPAIIFPVATGLQLLAMLRKRCAEGVSIAAWTMFAIANASLFVYTEKYGEIESIVGTLGTAGLNLCIVGVALHYRRAARAREAAALVAQGTDRDGAANAGG